MLRVAAEVDAHGGGVKDILRPLAPFDGAHAAARKIILPADVEELVRRAEAVEVEVKEGNVPLVFVDDGEGGAADSSAAAEAVRKAAGEGGLSHAELTCVGDNGATRQPFGQRCAELLGLLLAACQMLHGTNPPFSPF